METKSLFKTIVYAYRLTAIELSVLTDPLTSFPGCPKKGTPMLKKLHSFSTY
jgi:hypothetical protein